MSDERLKPWQRLPDVSCASCPAQVTRRITASDGDPEVSVDANGEAVITLVGVTTRVEVLACEDHYREISGELCDQLGGSSSIPLRYTWRYWLSSRLYLAWKWVRR